jgi:hypothetical protein
MLVKQLKRVNELDTEINTLHERLADLYAERSRLIGDDALLPSPAAKQLEAKAVHRELTAAWQTHSIKLPTYASLSKKLQVAVQIVNGLQADNPYLAGKLHIVAVPPHKTLFKALDQAHFRIAEDALANAAKPAGWSVIVVTDPQFSLPVESLSDSDEFRYKQYDCRALGLNQCIAAELQGVRVIEPENWTVLIKDSLDGTVPCATRHDGRILVELDDVSALLGNNYLQPVIEAA